MPVASDLSPYVDYARSSKAAIHGLPAAVSSLFEIDKRFAQFVEVVSQEFQEAIREQASADWGDAAETIFVAYDSASHLLRVFSTHPDAHILEYGGPDSPPKPVLRSAAYSAQQRFAPRLAEVIEKATR